VLTNAGIAFETIPADIDERAVSKLPASRRLATSPHCCREKALWVSLRQVGKYVMAPTRHGLGDRLFSKPAAARKPRAIARALRAVPTNCITAIAVARDGNILFSDVCHRAHEIAPLDEAGIDATWMQPGRR